jgi:tetratricopeptide (TPR) repeat protein
MELFKDDHGVKLQSLEKAREMNSSDWRVNLAWIDHYLDSRDFDQALKLAGASLKKYPGRSVLGLRYARALCGSGKYKECLGFLEKYEVLPYEGSTEGRNIYHETCIRAAYLELKRNNYRDAITYLEKAGLWPDNLGVGKPYDTDGRLENYLLGFACEKMGMQTKADGYFRKVMDHKTPPYLEENSKLYLQAIALRKYRQEEQATLLIENAIMKYPENMYIKWVKNVFEDDSFVESDFERLTGDIELQPYDTRYVDREFGLVRDCLKIIR